MITFPDVCGTAGSAPVSAKTPLIYTLPVVPEIVMTT